MNNLLDVLLSFGVIRKHKRVIGSGLVAIGGGWMALNQALAAGGDPAIYPQLAAAINGLGLLFLGVGELHRRVKERQGTS